MSWRIERQKTRVEKEEEGKNKKTIDIKWEMGRRDNHER